MQETSFLLLLLLLSANRLKNFKAKDNMGNDGGTKSLKNDMIQFYKSQNSIQFFLRCNSKGRNGLKSKNILWPINVLIC